MPLGSSTDEILKVLGWLTVAGWQALVASGGYLSGTLIQGLIILSDPNYEPWNWQGTLLFWATILIAVIFNTLISRALPQIEGLILVIHTLGFFAIMIPLVHLGPHGPASEVFTVFLNNGNWPSQGLSFFVGLMGLVFSFLGMSSRLYLRAQLKPISYYRRRWSCPRSSSLPSYYDTH